ncbi:MAG: hypothetical protein GWN18_10720, partial [Thermoplasmata archaeon]|nr:hypothetical protein [Thermoplasmata archaeon]NIS12510.1 hypothetical protein [Thermoplasmata archaeon]NIS20436.1 hypothetical protein [Thermoplasmata archaeon]NIT77782.1 hypothetical protein [Thermoplasmata archaeon]NIU49523.1 hypothetical protein [Thermoplasmata archaeon]
PGKTWRESLGDGQFEGDRWYHVLVKAVLPAIIYLASFFIVAGAYGSDMAWEWVNLTILFIVPPMGTATL